MKKLITVASLSFLIASCSKNSSNTPVTTSPDTTPPALTLNGGVNDTVSLNSVYVDPGSTAVDAVDGNISAHIAVTGTINKDLVGEYRLYYNVKDAAGNAAAQLTRYVYVANDADYLVGTYNAVQNCGASGTGNSTVTLSASTSVNNKISFGIPGNVALFAPNILVSGSSISAPMQTSGPASFSGSGTIASNKKSFSFGFTAVSGNTFQGTWSCTNNYTKQ